MIRSFLAKIVRLLFKIPFFKKRFFGFHQRIIAPFDLFKDVVKQVEFRRGIRLSLHIDDWIQENIYFVDEYEEAEFKALDGLVQKGDVFVDVGANIGLYTLYASILVGKEGHVLSFEPFSDNYHALKTNISLNENVNISLEKLAVGDTNAVIDLYYNDSEKNLGMVSTRASQYSRSEKVTCVTLDSYFENKSLEKIDVVKIDIEGNEYAAMLGMKNTLEKFHPTILIEILADNKSTQSENEKKIGEYLSNLGYQRHFIDDSGELSPVQKNPKRCNYIFIEETPSIKAPLPE